MPKSPMDSKAASRIQSNADRTGTNAGFKARAQSAAARDSSAKNKWYFHLFFNWEFVSCHPVYVLSEHIYNELLLLMKL